MLRLISGRFDVVAMATLVALPWISQGVSAQTNPWEIPKPDTYKGSMELQRRQQQQSVPNSSTNDAAPSAPMNNSIGANQAASKAAYAEWSKRPALAPEQNPLLGRWTWQPAKQNTNAMFDSSFANALGCGILFGDGMVEFRQGTIVGVQNGRESQIGTVAYRGGGKQVAALQQDGMKAFLLFNFVAPDRISLSGVPCVMTRANAAAATAVAPAKAKTGSAATR